MNPLLEEIYTLIDAYGRFLGLTLTPSSCRSVTTQLKRFFRHFLVAGKGYKTITREDIELYLSLQEWKQDYRAQNVLSLKRFYTYLRDKHVVTDNPAEKMNVPFPLRRPLVPVPLKSKVRRVLRKLHKDTSPFGWINRLLVELAYGSGLRRSELATLNVDDLDLTEKTVRVTGKGKKERVVPLSRQCMRSLKEYLPKLDPRQKPLFVRADRQRITPGGVGAAIKKATGLNPHYFRHACATHMLLAKCDIRYIQELLGHEQLNTTRFYTQLDKEDLRKIINQKHPGRLRSSGPEQDKTT